MSCTENLIVENLCPSRSTEAKFMFIQRLKKQIHSDDMKNSWIYDSGKLSLRWCQSSLSTRYDSPWMREATNVRGSYLAPPPDFASHSPFGGPSWFELHFARVESE